MRAHRGAHLTRLAKDRENHYERSLSRKRAILTNDDVLQPSHTTEPSAKAFAPYAPYSSLSATSAPVSERKMPDLPRSPAKRSGDAPSLVVPQRRRPGLSFAAGSGRDDDTHGTHRVIVSV